MAAATAVFAGARRLGPGVVWALAVAWACGTEPEPDGARVLSPTDHLLRASMALRGIRPSVAELDRVRAHPGALPAVVDTWLASPDDASGVAFGATIRDLHAEAYLLRDDTEIQLPILGTLRDRGYDRGTVHQSTVEAPLRFVEEIVAEDRPYTEILTAPYTLADQVVADVYGLPFRADGPEWQHTTQVDGRPQSGLLSDSQIWRRHTSNAANFHRGRANFISDTFLCEDIADRDVVIGGGIDTSDPLAVAEAVSTYPQCVACHAVLDPLAAFYWGYKDQFSAAAISLAYERGCEGMLFPGHALRENWETAHFCYPLQFYSVVDADGWQRFDLRGPGYFGEPADAVTDLGRLIAADPRFATCTARTFFGYLAEVERDDIPLDVVAPLQQTLVDSGWSAKQLARAVVLSDAFRTVRAATGPDGPNAFATGLLTVRPEQYGRTIEDLTGFRWLADQDGAGCDAGNNACWGTLDLQNSDLYGFRSLEGGVDSVTVNHPTHTATPTKVLAMRRLANEAAGWVVDADFGATPDHRWLLWGVEPDTVAPGAVRAELAWLHLRILAEYAEPDGPVVGATYGLWTEALGGSGSPAHAWKVVIAALLQDARMIYY